jgi:putative addiction module component (TIGR02574 family)
MRCYIKKAGAKGCLRQHAQSNAKAMRCYSLFVTANEMLAEILRLPVGERAKLALELLRSLDGEPEPGAAAEWDAEIERRAAEVKAGTADTMTLDEYRAHVSARRVARAGR